MRKIKKFLVISILALGFLITTVGAAALYQNINHDANVLGVYKALPEITKQTTTTNSSVSFSNLGGASGLLLKARGKWFNGTKWIQDPYGPEAFVTSTGTLNIVWFTKDFSSSMPMNIAFRNYTSNLTTPRVVGVWNHK